MILRKPYAFLIKYFRVIHAILTALLIFIFIKVKEIAIFFDKYISISDHLSLHVEPSITSIEWYIYLLIILAIGFFTIIYVLMRKKDKPTKFYTISIGFYFLLLLSVLFSKIQLQNLVNNAATLQMFKMARDILQMFRYLQYIFILVAIIRTLGFDIKRFNFQSDMKELNILKEDNEEFELDIKFDSDNLRTKFRRFLRVFKYFLQENKKLLTIIGCIAFGGFLLKAILDVSIYNKVYREKNNVKINGLVVNVIHSYEATKNYNYEDISEGKYKYYIIKFNIKNNSDLWQQFNTENLRLKVGTKYYGVVENKLKHFTDLGNGYTNQKLKSKYEGTYILVFKVDNDNSSSNIVFEMLRKNSFTIGELKYTKIKLSPENIDTIKDTKEEKIKNNLKMYDTIFGNIELKIDEYSFEENLIYTYEEVINGKKYTFKKVVEPETSDKRGRIFMKVKAEIKYNNVTNEKIMNNFISSFGKIRYKSGKDEYENDVPLKEYSFNDGYIFLEMSEKVKTADGIYLDIIIRNRKYIYKLK